MQQVKHRRPASRSALRPARPKDKTTVKVSKQVREWLRRQADRHGMSVQALTDRLLTGALRRAEKAAELEFD